MRKADIEKRASEGVEVLKQLTRGGRWSDASYVPVLVHDTGWVTEYVDGKTHIVRPGPGRRPRYGEDPRTLWKVQYLDKETLEPTDRFTLTPARKLIDKRWRDHQAEVAEEQRIADAAEAERVAAYNVKRDAAQRVIDELLHGRGTISARGSYMSRPQPGEIVVSVEEIEKLVWHLDNQDKESKE